MEKIIHKLINNFTEGVDTYTHNGSTWLIFSESKQWVIELTESKTLWYNYNFFNNVFSYTSMDVVENQQYITKWVEDNVINKVKDTILEKNITEGEVEEIIENGVKYTSELTHIDLGELEDTIKNGVKSTISTLRPTLFGVDDIIQDGVKETNPVDVMKFFDNKMNDAIENGVKETQFNDNENKSWVEGVIKGGVKVTLNTEYMPTSMVEDIIQSGVKHTEYGDWLDGDERLDDIIENGVKETKTPGKDGNILSTIEWMEENKSTSYTKMIDDVIDNGEKIDGTYAGGQRQSEKCKSVVEYGTKNPTD